MPVGQLTIHQFLGWLDSQNKRPVILTAGHAQEVVAHHGLR